MAKNPNWATHQIIYMPVVRKSRAGVKHTTYKAMKVGVKAKDLKL